MLTIARERARRFEDLRLDGSNARQRLVDQIEGAFGEDDLAYLLQMLGYAEGLDYDHPGLSKQIYLSHPYRVGAMSVQLMQPVNRHITALALIHNVLEVAAIPTEELVERVGETMYRELEALTVDRAQSSEAYKEQYYGGIRAAGAAAMIVKCLDKLDNMFMLCLNPDENIRHSYLAEIRDHVAPMVDENLPGLSVYFQELIENCLQTGHLEN